jgi:hypothetical protein
MLKPVGAEQNTRKISRQEMIRAFRLSPPVVWAKQILRWPGAAIARWRDRQASFRYELAVCAIFKDEAPFLDEWITFHYGVGVEHFYLYNNASSDSWLATLLPWTDRGIVTLMDFPGFAMQRRAYSDCIRRFRREARWIAFIDIDEFLFSPRQRDLRNVLLSYQDFPALFVYWHMFGSSGCLKRPPGPVVEAYTRRSNDRVAHKNGKTIVNARLVRRMEVHWAKTWVGETLDENGKTPPHGPDRASAVASHNELRINHYWSKSIEDLKKKVGRGVADRRDDRDLMRHLDTEATLNAVEDRLILPLWKEIKDDCRSDVKTSPFQNHGCHQLMVRASDSERTRR